MTPIGLHNEEQQKKLTHLDTSHLVGELGIKFKVVTLTHSPGDGVLVQNLVLRARQRVQQSNDILIRKVQLILDIVVAQPILSIK